MDHRGVYRTLYTTNDRFGENTSVLYFWVNVVNSLGGGVYDVH